MACSCRYPDLAVGGADHACVGGVCNQDECLYLVGNVLGVDAQALADGQQVGIFGLTFPGFDPVEV